MKKGERNMEQEAFRKALAESELVLVGIGEEWEKSPEGAEGYACLEKLLAGKNYFIVTKVAPYPYCLNEAS